jgi:hypothetical protein
MTFRRYILRRDNTEAASAGGTHTKRAEADAALNERLAKINEHLERVKEYKEKKLNENT